MSLETFCPATMCPLFAADGSPWTDHKNTNCEGAACAWFQHGGCTAASAAVEQVVMAAMGAPVLQLGRAAKRYTATAPKTYECARASECQWQVEAGDGLCPPRLALSRGLDPRVVAY